MYEFWTAAGKHVYLHEMYLRSFTYSAVPSPALRIIFDWGDDPVPQTYAGPVVEFVFEDVRILAWEEDGPETKENPQDPLGPAQVRAFDYSDEYFTLSTYTLAMSFTALTCRVEAHD